MFLCFCKNPAMALCADACNLSWENWGAQPAETAAFIQTQRGEPGNIWEHLWTSGNLGPELPRMSGSTVECAEEVRRRKPKKSVQTRSIKIIHTDSYCVPHCHGIAAPLFLIDFRGLMPKNVRPRLQGYCSHLKLNDAVLFSRPHVKLEANSQMPAVLVYVSMVQTRAQRRQKYRRREDPLEQSNNLGYIWYWNWTKM